jgi:hypothetical protein
MNPNKTFFFLIGHWLNCIGVGKLSNYRLPTAYRTFIVRISTNFGSVVSIKFCFESWFGLVKILTDLTNIFKNIVCRNEVG